MIITNETNLPASVYAAVASDGYSRGHADISVTDLIAPPRMVALREQYDASLRVDAADMAAPFIGTSVHEKLEKHKQTKESEQRVYIDVLGWVVGGKPDHFDPATGKLDDYKVIKPEEYIYGLKDEREQQLNIYAEMLRLNGYTVNSLNAVLFIIGFNWAKQERDHRYPPRSIVEVPIEMWARERVQQFVHDRVRLHQAARTALPNCTDEERWLRTTYAIMKEGRKTAIRTFSEEIEAEEWGIENGVAELGASGVSWIPGHRLEHRPGKPLRCIRYCVAAQVCAQFQGELNG